MYRCIYPYLRDVNPLTWDRRSTHGTEFRFSGLFLCVCVCEKEGKTDFRGVRTDSSHKEQNRIDGKTKYTTRKRAATPCMILVVFPKVIFSTADLTPSFWSSFRNTSIVPKF